MVWLHRQTLSCLALGLACLVSKRLVIAQEFAGSPVDADAPIDPAVQGSAALPFPLTSPQLSPPYSLDIIDTRVHALDFFYQYDFDGSDVNVYIMSTGIRSTHAEFQQSSGSGPGRVLPGWSFDGDEGDCVGYGTHAAGVVGGLTYGVAKDVNMYPVKIFQGCETGSTTTTAEILQNGTNWVLQNAQQPAVVLLLLYAPSNEVVDGVVDQLASAGLFVVVGAGNSGVPACTVSPARSSQAVTVAPVNQSLYQLDTSNSGRCVDIFAPGGMVPSAGIGADDAVGIHSSANPAAAVVAGVAAQFLEARRSARPGEVRSFLFATSSKGLVEDTFNSPNRLIYNGPLLCSPQLQDRPARLNRQQGRRLEQETRGAESDAEIIVSELQVSQTQPDFSDCFDDFGDPSGFVYFLARVDVASASSLLTRDSFVINNGTGSVRCINPRTSDPCDGFIIQGTVPVSEAVQIEIEVTCEVPLEAVKDTFTGNRVPTTEPPPATAVLSDFRPAGKLYAVNMQYPSTRAETDATAPLIHLSFSEAVTGVTAADFSVELSPPGAGSIRNLFPLGQDSRHYLAELSLQPAYSGTVTVQYIGGSTDVDGNANTQVDPVSFFKQTTSLTAPTVAWDICPSEET